MTNQQGAPEALRPITRYEVVDCIDSKHVPAVIPNKDGPWVRYEDHAAALVEAQQPAPSAAAPVGEAPLPLLVRDIAADLGTTPIQVCTALAQLGFGGHSVNMAVTPRMAKSLRAHFAPPTPQADSAQAEPLQAFDSPRAKALMRAWEQGWAACRDAEYVGEEAQNDAFNSSNTLTLCIAEDQQLPAPQADSQPAADEIVSVAREQGLPETEIEGVFRVNADDLCRVVAADRAARAPADSQPVPQGETNVQLDIDSNHSTPEQQRDVAGSVALGQPVGNRTDQAASHLGTQGNKLLTVAERNIRSFLRSAVFKSESDREAALNCVDVLWEAARATADSVLEAAALSSEQQRAIFEAYESAASESYFEVRPQIDCNDRRRVFKAGYERGWDAARKQGGHK